jgi:hypothetical protein
VLLIWSSTAFYGQQNLIINPSFENSNVLQGQPWFDNIYAWWRIYSADAFSTEYLLDNTSYDSCFACVPLNLFGFQYPQEGANYVGFGTAEYHPPLANFTVNEYVGGYFTDTLRQGKKYKFKFYSSIADSFSTLYSNSLQVKVLNDSICSDYPNCQIDGDLIWNGDTLIRQTTDWVKIEFDFIANGGEKAFLVGNFRPHLGIEYEVIQGKDTLNNGFVTYWFLDNFSLTEILEPTPSIPPIPFLDNVTVASNPGNEQYPTTFTAKLNNDATANLTIFDEAGRIVAKHTFVAGQEKYVLQNLAGAVYFYTFESSNEVFLSGKVIQF